MAQWKQVCRMEAETIRWLQVKTYSEDVFPLEVRHYLAQWLEDLISECPGEDADNPIHIGWAQTFLQEFLQAIEMKMNCDGDFVLHGLVEAIRLFKNNYGDCPLSLIAHIKTSLRLEAALVRRLENGLKLPKASRSWDFGPWVDDFDEASGQVIEATKPEPNFNLPEERYLQRLQLYESGVDLKSPHHYESNDEYKVQRNIESDVQLMGHESNDESEDQLHYESDHESENRPHPAFVLLPDPWPILLKNYLLTPGPHRYIPRKRSQLVVHGDISQEFETEKNPITNLSDLVLTDLMSALPMEQLVRIMQLACPRLRKICSRKWVIDRMTDVNFDSVFEACSTGGEMKELFCTDHILKRLHGNITITVHELLFKVNRRIYRELINRVPGRIHLRLRWLLESSSGSYVSTIVDFVMGLEIAENVFYFTHMYQYCDIDDFEMFPNLVYTYWWIPIDGYHSVAFWMQFLNGRSIVDVTRAISKVEYTDEEQIKRAKLEETARQKRVEIPENTPRVRSKWMSGWGTKAFDRPTFHL